MNERKYSGQVKALAFFSLQRPDSSPFAFVTITSTFSALEPHFLAGQVTNPRGEDFKARPLRLTSTIHWQLIYVVLSLNQWMALFCIRDESFIADVIRKYFRARKYNPTWASCLQSSLLGKRRNAHATNSFILYVRCLSGKNPKCCSWN